LDDEEVLELAKIGKAMEREHGVSLDIEFAIDQDSPAGNNVIILQCRPETVWSAKRAQMKVSPLGNAAKAVLETSLPEITKGS